MFDSSKAYPKADITCKADTEFSEEFSCEKALQSGATSWATKFGGPGSWIKLTLKKKIPVSAVWMMNRHYSGENSCDLK